MQWEISEDYEGPSAKEIFRQLAAYNDSKVPPSPQRPLVIALRDETGTLVAGLRGLSFRGWLFVAQAWVAESQRGKGLGAELFAQAEGQARERKCVGIYLDTYSFQARGFYERLGYELFGELADFPPGHRKFYFRKLLGAED